MKTKDSFVFRKDWYEALQGLDDNVRLESYDAVMRYAFFGEVAETSPLANVAMRFILPQVQRDIDKYNQICESRKVIGSKGGTAKASKSKQEVANGSKSKQKVVSVADNDSDSDIKESNDSMVIDDLNKKIELLEKEKEELKKEIIKKEKEEEKEEKQNYSELEKTFDDFRRRYKEYGGKVRGLDAELDNLKKKHKDWKEVIPLLMPSLEKENEARMQANIKREFFPPMKNLQTYINNRSWECYLDEDSKYDGNEYRPLVDGIMQRWDAKRKRLLFNGYLSMLNDGYTPDNRPDGATIEHSLDTWVWSAILRDWIKQ